MKKPRIVSLLPSATEIVCALGLRDCLVGRSHECDYPTDVAEVPVMTYSTLGIPLCPEDATMSAAEIDKAVSAQLREGLSLYGLNYSALELAKPDIIVTQELCDVCAVSFSTVKQAVRDLSDKWQGFSAQVVSLEPTTINDIFATIITMGDLTDSTKIARGFVNNLQDRVEKLHDMLISVNHHPTIMALEWLDPPFAPGHWVPEQIELAGGKSALGEAGRPSKRTSWDNVIHCQPEMVVMMPCGYDLEGTLQQFETVKNNEVWQELPAPYLNQVCAVNATAYFSRPGPRVVDGAEILAGLIHPNLVPHPPPAVARRVQPFALTEFVHGYQGLNASAFR
jgi:iron complex transport system substrate-binding protein